MVSWAWPYQEAWPMSASRWNSALGIISAISWPSCGGACTSSVKAITCMGTRTDGSWARWS
jgi:hypothetical protein